MFIQGFLDGENDTPAVLEVVSWTIGDSSRNFHLRIAETPDPEATPPIGAINFNIDAAIRLKEYLNRYIDATQ